MLYLFYSRWYLDSLKYIHLLQVTTSSVCKQAEREQQDGRLDKMTAVTTFVIHRFNPLKHIWMESDGFCSRVAHFDASCDD